MYIVVFFYFSLFLLSIKMDVDRLKKQVTIKYESTLNWVTI